MPRAWTGAAAAIILAVLIVVAIVRIALTYPIFSGTFDEGDHISAGLEWIEQGVSKTEYEHPPLVRAILAFGPYLRGVRRYGARVGGAGGVDARAQYAADLTSARIGNLPFLAIATITVFLWTRRWFGDAASRNDAALWAAFLFLCLPPILGHAALATLDVAACASLAVALYQLLRWMETPTLRRAIFLGLAVGFAFGTKFSNIPFLGACALALLLYLAITDRASLFVPRPVQITAALLAMFLFLWATYRFTMHPLPLTEFAAGIRQVMLHNKRGSTSYLLGEVSQIGWWYFFPVVLAVKTPIPFLLLAAAGMRVKSWQQRATLLFPAAILLFCISTWINLGVRHILIVYVPLSILGGYFVARYRAAVVLALLLAVDSLHAHPDYLAYFNQFAGSHPEHILVESDLDWGQDLRRLSVRLKQLGVQDVSLAYFGTAPLDKYDLPVVHQLPSRTPAHGWIAISVRYLNIEYNMDESYAWLKPYQPQEIVGRTIWLYHLP